MRQIWVLGALLPLLGCGLQPADWIVNLGGTRGSSEPPVVTTPDEATASSGHTMHHPQPSGEVRRIPAGRLRTVPDGADAPLFGDLGDHHREITTSSPLAQKFFDQGLILTYGFNHSEAIRSFQEAQRQDPTCSMCYWGEAYAYGPNINAPMEEANVPAAWAALTKARASMSQATAVEQALINALAKRYVEEPVEDRTPLDRDYAAAMREVAKSFPEDDDVQTLFAEALMDTMPWDYYETPEEPREETREVVATLEAVMARSSDHPGAIHLYIHAVEPSTTAERAEGPADRLRDLVPGAGHLVHMPSHIYLRIGRYHDAAVANQKAAAADESYITQCRAQGFYPLAYYPHNVHFLWTAATFEGRSQVAIESARKLVGLIPPEMLEELPMLEEFQATVLFTLVRFGAWDEILAVSEPTEKWIYTRGIWHYAQGVAQVAKGDLDAAKRHLAAIESTIADEAIAGMEFFSFATPQQLLGIAADVVAARIAGAAGDWNTSVSRLENAVATQDSLRYTEPPPWHFPVRDALGQALLRADRPQEAVVAYRKQLEKTPHSGWTLLGLAQALEASGENEAAAGAKAAFEKAWERADVELTSSMI